jgi:hypothetical protein
MSSRKDHTASRERRLRRVLIRYGMHLMICQKPDFRVQAHGGYMVRDGDTMKIVFGDRDYPFSANLDEVEEWVEANTKA